jgi:protein-tyrosine phosphatase
MARKATPLRVLVVCTANECRSVIGHETFEASEISSLIAVSSAGTGAQEGTPRCAETVARAVRVNHTSTHIESVDLASFDAIFTMEKAHSSKIAQLAPAVRAKTFTLPQAVTLAGTVLDALTEKSQEFEPDFPANWAALTDTARLQWLLSEMNEARGFVSFDTEEIPDAHGKNAAAHDFALPFVEESVKTLSRYVAETLAFNDSTTTGS